MRAQTLFFQKRKPQYLYGLKAVLALNFLLCTAAEVSAATADTASRQGGQQSSIELAVRTPLQLQLQPGQVQRLQLDVPAGAVVRGSLQALGVALDVETPAGRHLRRLTQGAGVDHSFTWQSRGGAQERLVLRAQDMPGYVADGEPGSDGLPAPQPGAVRLNIEQLLPALAEAEQQPVPEQELRSPKLKALQAWLERGGNTSAFWRDMARHGSPLVEPWDANHQLVSFVWRGARQSVRLFGSPSGNHDPLQRLGHSDVWWTSFVMPKDARLSYGFAPDVPQVSTNATVQRRAILSTLQRDPLNRQTWGVAPAVLSMRSVPDPYEGRSVLALSKAPAQPWVQARPGVATGALQRHWLSSEALGNGRDIWIYRPKGWDQADAAQRSLLVLFDAHAYLQQVPTPTIIDNLMADGLLPTTALVLVANGPGDARGRELPLNPQFADFMGQTLMPWLQRQGLEVPAQRTVLAGSSYGGLASGYVALRYPQRFGNVLSLSGSYWWAPKDQAPNWLAREYAQAQPLPIRFYLDAGIYEGARGGQAGIRETSRELGDVLRSKGYFVVQREHSTGHDYVHWQGSLACGLLALIGKPVPLQHQAQVQQACGKP